MKMSTVFFAFFFVIQLSSISDSNATSDCPLGASWSRVSLRQRRASVTCSCTRRASATGCSKVDNIDCRHAQPMGCIFVAGRTVACRKLARVLLVDAGLVDFIRAGSKKNGGKKKECKTMQDPPQSLALPLINTTFLGELCGRACMVLHSFFFSSCALPFFKIPGTDAYTKKGMANGRNSRHSLRDVQRQEFWAAPFFMKKKCKTMQDPPQSLALPLINTTFLGELCGRACMVLHSFFVVLFF